MWQKVGRNLNSEVGSSFLLLVLPGSWSGNLKGTLYVFLSIFVLLWLFADNASSTFCIFIIFVIPSVFVLAFKQMGDDKTIRRWYMLGTSLVEIGFLIYSIKSCITLFAFLAGYRMSFFCLKQEALKLLQGATLIRYYDVWLITMFQIGWPQSTKNLCESFYLNLFCWEHLSTGHRTFRWWCWSLWSKILR